MTLMKSLALAAGLALVAGGASATTYTMGAGKTECRGGGGFSKCTLNGSPTIIKFGDKLEVSDKNSGFPSVTGDEFTFSNLVGSLGNLTGLNWTYTVGTDDPLLTAVVVKAGNNWAWTSDFTFEDGVYSGSLSTLAAGLTNKKGDAQAISHITFFDTGTFDPPAAVPLPAGGLLLLSALGGLAIARRRKKA